MSISTTSSSIGCKSCLESDVYRTISASVVGGGRGTGGELPLLAVTREFTTVSSSLEQLAAGEDRSVLMRLAAEGTNDWSSSLSFSSSSSSSSSSLLLLFDVLFLPKFNASLCSGITAAVAVTIGPLYTGVRFRAVAAVYAAAAAAAAADGLVGRPAKMIIYYIKCIIIPYFPSGTSRP